MTGLTRVDVAGEQPYPVLVGDGILDQAQRLLPDGVSRAAVICPPPVRRFADQLAAQLVVAGITPLLLDVPDAEQAKTVAVAGRCWEALGRAGFTRSDAVIAVGGGAVTDLAGFVAACWLRGTPVVYVATSLLGMVDAAVGGKTGVNTPAGKNLVGAFHPPVGVVCDVATLRALPGEELTAGLAEVVKCGFIADPAILDLLEADPAGAVDPDSPTLREAVERAIQVKADVVAADLRESSLREILNYGHTLAHAIEQRESYRWRHGHAVSVGLVYAAALSRLSGRLGEADAARHRRVLELLGLPTTYQSTSGQAGAAGRATTGWAAARPPSAGHVAATQQRPSSDEVFAELLAAMRVDKKARGSHLRFVVLDGIGQPGILHGPDPQLLRAAYEEVAP